MRLLPSAPLRLFACPTLALEHLANTLLIPPPRVPQVESELRRLGFVYGVYAEYADAVRQYSGQLWSELDVGRMVDGVQEVGGQGPAHVPMGAGVLLWQTDVA